MKSGFTLLLITLSILSYSCSANAQQSAKLTGTVIGTTRCVDYDRNNALTSTVNTAANLFDGKFNTYFATYERSYTWAGLDLGEKHVITAVAYCPRQGYPGRSVMGMFEGANSPDFMDAVPLHIIDRQPQENMMTKDAVECSRGFRYVRYVGPSDVRCNIAELEFHGYKSEGDDTRLMQLSNLPTISIHTVGAKDIVSKTTYIEGTISIISNDGKEIFTAPLDVRGRGNASWGFPKKPYRIKLKEKAKLLGCPAKEKSWTLISNYGDKTLMRNLLAFDLSRRLEMPYTSVGIPVDLILNGEYKGCYQLCDQLNVDKERVNIDKKTGTYVEVDAYAYDEPANEWFTATYRQIPVSIKHPEDAELAAKYSSIKAHFEKMVTAVHSANSAHPTDGLRKYLDLDTFLRHFLIGELSGNTDTYWSVNMYRKDDVSDLYYTGPVWDFDLAYENDNRTYPINNNSNWIYNSKGSYANGMKDFVNKVLSDSKAYAQLKSIYATYRDNGTLSTEELIGVVDRYEDEITESASLNFKRWNILYQYVHQNYQALGSYDKEVETVRKYIRKRIEWMDKKLAYVPSSTIEQPADHIQVTTHQGNISITGISEETSIRIFHINGWEIINTKTTSNLVKGVDKGTYIVEIKTPGAKRKTVKCIID